MDITPIIPSGKKVISGYGGGVFKVSDTEYNSSILIAPDAVLEWEVNDISNITPASLAPLLEGRDIEIIIIGCGEQHTALPEIIKNLRQQGINAEIMTTGAACRTYNVLLAEGRQVAAALVAV